MTVFRTCHTCAIPGATCATRSALQSAISALGITSVKHRCADYQVAFRPGDAVKVLTLPWYPTEDEPVSAKRWFPGHFIRLTGTRALVFVPKGAASLDGCRHGFECRFEPNGNGFLKVPLSRVATRDGDAVDVIACNGCAAILSLGQPCGRDPCYTPARNCLLASRPAERAPARLPQGDSGRTPSSPTNNTPAQGTEGS